ncbi:MAG: hypothetical protein R2708_13205 [Vicinamibacterales bacterium]
MLKRFEELASNGRVSDALKQFEQLRAPTLEQKALRSELEALAGRRGEALRISLEIARSGGPATALIRALSVAGRISFFTGTHAEGRARFTRAIELGRESREAALEAHAHSQYVESLLRFVGLNAAAGELGAYKRAAIRAGTHESLATLHRVFAEAEMRTGRGFRAMRELELSAFHVEAPATSLRELNTRSPRAPLLGFLARLRKRIRKRFVPR